MSNQINLTTFRRNIVSPKSENNYLGSVSNFILWCYENAIIIVQLVMQNTLSTRKQTYDVALSNLISIESEDERQIQSRKIRNKYAMDQKRTIKQWILNNHEDHPIYFDLITGDLFTTYILSLRKGNDELPGMSTYTTHRAGMKHLFRYYNIAVPATLSSLLESDYKSLKRTVAERTNDEGGDVRVGKSPLEFSFYCTLSEICLKNSTKEDVFGNCFIILCWNLMCRVGNCEAICLNHMEWTDDSLVVYFAQGKTDQSGEKAKHPRHLYANPLKPHICPVLALGLYLITNAFTNGQVKLFPGSSQYERFRAHLEKSLKSHCADELASRGLSVNCIGTHSIRKGAASYCASGTTAAPPTMAIHLRAGWTFTSVQDRYIHVEAAGDQYVGRTITGLPILDSNFAISPPYFKSKPNEFDQIMQCNFINLPSHLSKVVEYCLASIVYHKDYLINNFKNTHPLFKTTLFRDRNLLALLHTHVHVNQGSMITNNGVVPLTGIPPHVQLMSQFYNIQQSMETIVGAIRDCSKETVQGVINAIEDRAMIAGHVTPDRIESLIETSIQRALNANGLQDILNTHPIANPVQEIEVQDEWNFETYSSIVYNWGGKFSRVPADFKFPSCTVAVGYQLWCSGDQSNQLPPFRMYTSADMPNRTQQARLSEFQFIMRRIDTANNLQHKDLREINPVIATTEFKRVINDIGIPLTTVKGRIRRVAQINWRTAYNTIKNQ